jgi:hypothetical protein
MRSFGAAVTTALSAGSAVLVTFVRLEFPSVTIGLSSSNWNFDHGGITYLGANGLGSINPIVDHPGELPGMQLELQVPDATMISLALDDVDQVQGSAVTISTAIIDSSTYQIIDVATDWVGYADRMTIVEDGEKCSIGLSAESKGVDLLSGNPLVYNDPDQQLLYPGDRAFEYVVDQADKPVVWPSRAYFQV